ASNLGRPPISMIEHFTTELLCSLRSRVNPASFAYASPINQLLLSINGLHPAGNWNGQKESLGFNENFSTFLQFLYKAFTSNSVKIELGGPASAIGGKGATSANIKANATLLGVSRNVCVHLELFKGRSANDAVGALALDLYEAFYTASNQRAELEMLLDEEKKKNSKILDAVVQGKANSIHFRPHAILNESTLVWDEDHHSEALPPEHPSVVMPENSIFQMSLPVPMQPQLETFPSDSPTSAPKHLKHSSSRRRRIGSSRNSSLKLAVQNSYARIVKQTCKGALKDCNSTVCNSECEAVPEILDSANDKRKYRDIDMDILAKIEAGGENRSLKTDLWARRHYLEWRKFQGLPEMDIEELPLPELAESLVKFFCMVKKRNGDLFPSESLKAMFRAFVRILQFHYKRLAILGSYNGPIVDASKDALFEKARLACIEAMKHSLANGANQKKRRTDEDHCLSEEEILQHQDSQSSTPQGLSKRLCYYVIHKFNIYGDMELYNTTDVEFQRILNENGEVFWQYDERRALKYKNKTLFREIKCCAEKDVVDCFDKYFTSLPPKPLEGEPRRLFLAPIKRPTSNVWFRHQNIGVRTLLKWYKQMCCTDCHPELNVANCSPGQQSELLTRTSCSTVGDNNELNSCTNLNSSSVDRSEVDPMSMAGKHSTEFDNSVEISSDSDADSLDSKDDTEIDMCVLNSHAESNSNDLRTHTSSEIDEINL
ncbi:hypothetical protein KI387_026531, partial [Taxus chinensis]